MVDLASGEGKARTLLSVCRVRVGMGEALGQASRAETKAEYNGDHGRGLAKALREGGIHREQGGSGHLEIM